MITAAFFIAPDGEIIPVATSHIATVISQPAKFGLSLDEIMKEYKETGELLGLEGKARKTILLRLLSRGWVRIRLHPNKHWSINIHALDGTTRKLLRTWILAYLHENKTVSNFDQYMKARIDVFSNGNCREYLLHEIISIQEISK